MTDKLKQKERLTSLSQILANDDVKRLISGFIDEDMADAEGVVLIWIDRKKNIMLRTNLNYISCLGILGLALRANEK